MLSVDGHAAPTAARTFETLPDIARKFRRMTTDFNADDFVLLLENRSAKRGKLWPCMDGAFPGNSLIGRKLSDRLSDSMVRRIAGSTAPFWWAANGYAEARSGLPRLRWGEKIAPPIADTTALLLPLTTPHGDVGALVFIGAGLSAANDRVFDAHARAFALFAVVARLRPTSDGRQPAMSNREIECLKLTADGLTSDQIATRLGLSVHTANQYLANTMKKLNAVSRMHAVAKALRGGLID